MDRDPGDFPAHMPRKPFAEMTAEEQDSWLESLPPPPGLPATNEEFAASIARARADVAAGRVYPHAVVGKWLRTWGKDGYQPFHTWLAEQDG